MIWGGSLNEEGSDYLRRLREADKVISFLENLKNHLEPEKSLILLKTIEIIIEHISQTPEKRD